MSPYDPNDVRDANYFNVPMYVGMHGVMIWAWWGIDYTARCDICNVYGETDMRYDMGWGMRSSGVQAGVYEGMGGDDIWRWKWALG